MSQAEPRGNTRPRVSNQLYLWFFTLKAEEIPRSVDLWDLLSQIAKKFTFQLEEGEGGYRHYQGVFSLKIKHRMPEVKNMIARNVHLEPCGNWWASIAYCSKSETRIDGPWDEKKRPIKLIEKLRDWQKDLESELMKEPDDRKIIWYYDEEGGMGKTQFSKYMASKHGAVIITSGKVADIAYIIKQNIPKIIIFNISRTSEDYFNYQALENVKDGLITSTKYDSSTLIFDSPHVVVMSNFMPNENALSKDRWEIRDSFGNKKEEIDYDAWFTEETEL